MEYAVKRFISLRVALEQLEPFIVQRKQLLNGRPLQKFGRLLPRELVGNWLLCVAVNSGFDTERLTFTSQPDGMDGDGVILDTVSGATVLTEHVVAYRRENDGQSVDVEASILQAIVDKHRKGENYGAGRTLVVFREDAGGTWYPNKVARNLPQDLAFEAVWVCGLERVEEGQYQYHVARLDMRQRACPVWRVTIAPEFTCWTVEVLQ
jgi:hypothetical protein